MLTPIFRAKIESGKLVLAVPRAYDAHLRNLDGKEVEVIIRVPKKTRSLQQNKYYWPVVVGLIADHLGLTPYEAHEWLRQEFLPCNELQIGQKRHIIGRSTTELSTVEFEQYTANVRMWAGREFQIFIPLPNEVIS